MPGPAKGSENQQRRLLPVVPSTLCRQGLDRSMALPGWPTEPGAAQLAAHSSQPSFTGSYARLQKGMSMRELISAVAVLAAITTLAGCRGNERGGQRAGSRYLEG